MLAVKLRSNLQQFSKGLDEFHRRQVSFAAATAINMIGEGAQADIVHSMQATFDRPTPYTLRATYFKRAKKTDLTAFVGIREFAGKGTPAWKYLGPQVTGGPRGQKRFERRLAATNRGAPYAIPAKGAQLDSYGNMSRGQISKILSAVGALGDTGQNASSTTARRSRRKGMVIHQQSYRQASDYFIATSKRSGKPIGVYRLTRAGSKGSPGEVEPVLIFSDKPPSYAPRWPIQDVVLKSIETHRQGAFSRAWAQALATAR